MLMKLKEILWLSILRPIFYGFEDVHFFGEYITTKSLRSGENYVQNFITVGKLIFSFFFISKTMNTKRSLRTKLTAAAGAAPHGVACGILFSHASDAEQACSRKLLFTIIIRISSNTMSRKLLNYTT